MSPSDGEEASRKARRAKRGATRAVQGRRQRQRRQACENEHCEGQNYEQGKTTKTYADLCGKRSITEWVLPGACIRGKAQTEGRQRLNIAILAKGIWDGQERGTEQDERSTAITRRKGVWRCRIDCELSIIPSAPSIEKKARNEE